MEQPTNAPHRPEDSAVGPGRSAAVTSPDLLSALRRLGMLHGSDAILEPLTGGVSSEIVKVTADGRTFAVKRALPKLKVAADWSAPIERNEYEVAWMRTAGRIAPNAVPQILAYDAGSGLFAMTYLDPARHPVWKGLLRDGVVDPSFAAAVGGTVATIHAKTAGDAAIAAHFATDHIFHPIRLEPYLEATAAGHPALAHALMRLSRDTLATKRALVHGDVSPKNILAGPDGPVFLDAECAWYGDPAFDLAFCLNHLLLKCLWNRAAAPSLLRAFDALALAYLRVVDWEPVDEVEARAARLLPALLLARIDGKSPVEYVREESDRALVRAVAAPLITDPPSRLAAVRNAWSDALGLLSAAA